MEYLDFEIEIDAGSGRDYPVAVIRSPAGEARGTMTFPFEPQQLTNHLQSLEIALLRSSGPARRRAGPSPEEDAVRDFGKALFEALLPADLRSRYVVSRERAAAAGKGLRFKLRIRPPELASLPWEFLWDPAEADFVALSRQTPLVRHLEMPQATEPLAVTAPLRVLAMVASPSDLPKLDTANERARMEQALKPLVDAGQVEITWLTGQTWRDLNEAMWKGPWHILHFIGHGGFDPEDGRGLVVMAGDDGTSVRLGADQLARLVNDHDSLRLVLLNSCDGARSGTEDVFSSSAATLVRRGVPAVLAMQYEITDDAAIEFSRTFYQAIAAGMPVDAAVSAARLAISISLRDSLEWGTPVLYMRSGNGVLFNVALDPAAVRPAPPVVEPAPVEPPPPAPPPADPSPSPAPRSLGEALRELDSLAPDRPFSFNLTRSRVSRWTGSALFYANIQNYSAAPITVQFEPGEAAGVRVDIVPEVEVGPDRLVSIPLVVTPLSRPRIGRGRERHFTVLANDGGADLPVAASADYTEPPGPLGFLAGGIAGLGLVAAAAFVWLGGGGGGDDGAGDPMVDDPSGNATAAGETVVVPTGDGLGQVAFVSFRDGVESIYMRDADGGNEVLLSPQGWTAIQPAWSPDGSKLAFASTADGDWEVYVLDVETGEYTKMTDHDGEDSDPVWSPDGSRIAFYSERSDAYGDIWTVDVASRSAQLLIGGEGWQDEPGSWSSDGAIFAFSSNRETGIGEIYLADGSGNDVRRLTSFGAHTRYPRFQPGADTIVFTTHATGVWSIWLMELNGSARPITTSESDDQFPNWAGEDRVVFISSRPGGTVACPRLLQPPCADQDIYVVDLEGGEPVRLFGTPAFETESAPRPRP